MAIKCQSGLVLCLETADAVCSVCGRYFCLRHGNLAAPHCRRCARAFADRRREEAAATAEKERRLEAAARNEAGHCGWHQCQGPQLALCGHCGLRYCSSHSTQYHYTYRYRTRRGVETRPAEVVLCDACKPALKLYKREKTWLEG